MENQDEIKKVDAPVVNSYKELRLTSNQCLEIMKTVGKPRPYTNTKDGSRYDGLYYNTFRYKGKSFTVPVEDSFTALQESYNLGTVHLMPTDNGYDFLLAIPRTALDASHKSTVMRDAITVEFVQSKLTMEELNETA